MNHQKRLIARVLLALIVIASSAAMAQGRGSGGGGFHGGGGAWAGAPSGGGWHGGSSGGNWSGGGYYGGRGYYGGWGRGYWAPSVGFYFGGPAYLGGWPYAYGYPYGYGYAPFASYTVASPSVYIEQQIDVSPPPAQILPTPPSTQGNPGSPPTFWFYCTKPAGYYPYVQNCEKAWLPVVPQANTGTPTRPKLAR